MPSRVGAKTRKEIPLEILEQLNQGTIETATLVEQLAIDFTTLMSNVFADISTNYLERMNRANAQGIVKRMAIAGALMLEHFREEAYDTLSRDISDTVRGWGAFALAMMGNISLETKLTRLQILADDPHFGVREWAWMAIRNEIIEDIETSIQLLIPWSKHPSENLRRFAVESTRPRGVWARHCRILKASPEPGEILLNNVMKDPSRYVQNAAANWINDAAKSCPNWARQYTARWQDNSQSPNTRYIVKRATRNFSR